MRYNAQTKRLEIQREDMQRAADSLLYAMRHIRQMAGLPLDKHDRKGLLTDADHAQKGIIDAAEKLGIHLGGEWGEEIDLRPKQ